MRKLITLLLIAALLLPAAALADLPDISGLTEAELIELNRKIQLRLFSEKLVEGVEVPPGVYMVGEDIPEGKYRVEYRTENKYSLATFDAYREEPFFSFQSILGYTNPYEIGKIELSNGIKIRIENASLFFYGYSGLFD
jgi:hypothetical protein